MTKTTFPNLLFLVLVKFVYQFSNNWFSRTNIDLLLVVTLCWITNSHNYLISRCIFQLSRGAGCYSPTTNSPSSSGTTQLTSSSMIGSLKKYQPLADSRIRPFDEIPGPSGLHQLPYLGLLFQMKPFSNDHNLFKKFPSFQCFTFSL